MPSIPSPRAAAIDSYNNDLSELTDDGIEMDYSERNARFHNRLTNVFQGISMQPVYGGPVYVFRNVMYNLAVEPFKLHNNPSGCLIFHNTSVKNGTPAQLLTSESVRHCLSRNNLYAGTQAHYGMDFTACMMDCDFDYDGFAGGPYEIFLRWNGIRYGTLEEVKQRAPVLKHAVLLDARTLFASSAMPPTDVARSHDTSIDLRLSSRSKAVDAGQALSGWNGRLRVDADYRDPLAATTIHPFRVVHRWTEHGQAKTHTELITKLPAKYAIRTNRAIVSANPNEMSPFSPQVATTRSRNASASGSCRRTACANRNTSKTFSGMACVSPLRIARSTACGTPSCSAMVSTSWRTRWPAILDKRTHGLRGEPGVRRHPFSVLRQAHDLGESQGRVEVGNQDIANIRRIVAMGPVEGINLLAEQPSQHRRLLPE